MKKLLFLLLLSSVVAPIGATTYVKVLEDDSVITQKDGIVKIELHQTLGDVPVYPCLAGYKNKLERPEGLDFWGKTKFFFKQAYHSMTWKKAAYGLGGIVVAGGAYRFGKRARRLHYGVAAKDKINGWFNKK